MKNKFQKICLVVFCVSTSAIYSQTSDLVVMQKAFASSYTSEYNKDYSKAIADLKTIYHEKSYELNLRLGWLNYENQLYSESISYYKNAMKLMPYSIEAKFGFVYPAAALGNWDDVLKTYLDILSIDPQNTTALYRLGIIYYSRNDYGNAEKYFEKLVNLYPFGYDGVINLAYAKMNVNKTEEARLLFNKALMIYPSDTTAAKGLRLLK
ncbi:MAG: tetratricopeptide repeat protein [Bacteroidetes bacterium]|nr:tetratricopeptide repeat protein [Bacteroidota bacterium]